MSIVERLLLPGLTTGEAARLMGDLVGSDPDDEVVEAALTRTAVLGRSVGTAVVDGLLGQVEQVQGTMPTRSRNPRGDRWEPPTRTTPQGVAGRGTPV